MNLASTDWADERRVAKAQRKMMLYFQITENRISASQSISVQSYKCSKVITKT